MKCQNCFSDDTTKVSLLWSREARYSHGVGVGLGQIQGLALWAQESNSPLGKALSPPSRPDTSSFYDFLVFAISVLGILGLVASVTCGSTIYSWASGGLVVVAVVLSWHHKVCVKNKEPKWRNYRRVWERAVHCDRCGSVTDPVTGRSADTIRIATLY
jgi:hypothetical protein